MCGIAGLLDPRGTQRELDRLANAMADRLSHRGPDDSGVWQDIDSRIALSHRRLSILDLSASGHQPMHSADGRYVISFNGEIYNFQELRASLEGGEKFRGHSDTEVMLAAISQWGLRAALEKFNGMFAFALWDCKEKVLYLCRDRIGKKPLFYGQSGKVFLFASELKAFVAVPGFEPQVDEQALELYLRYAYVPSPLCILNGVQKLGPGSFVKVTADGKVGDPEVYWSMSDVAVKGTAALFSGGEKEAFDSVETSLRNATRRRMVSDVPLGVMLSGGIDSSLIAALMQSVSETPIRTFSIGFDSDGYNEAEHAKGVAAHLGTSHTELYVSARDALNVIPKLPQIYDEPFADSSQIPTYLVSKMARRDVTVCLTGDGGDEFFGGYNRYLWGSKLWNGTAWMPGIAKDLTAAALSIPSSGMWQAALSIASSRVSNPVEKMSKLAQALRARTPLELYEQLISQWAVPPVRRSSGATLQRMQLPSGFSRRPIEEQMMLLDAMFYLPDDILVKADRASMANSLELRSPLLDHEVIELSWRIPLAMKIQGGTGKRPLRELLYRHVPRALVDRPKKGFGVPLAQWLRSELRDWAESLVSSIESDQILDSAEIRRKWEEHRSGRRDWHYPLWVVLMYQSWKDQLTSAKA